MRPPEFQVDVGGAERSAQAEAFSWKLTSQRALASGCRSVRTRVHGPLSTSVAVQWPSCVVASHHSCGQRDQLCRFGSSFTNAWYVAPTLTSEPVSKPPSWCCFAEAMSTIGVGAEAISSKRGPRATAPSTTSIGSILLFGRARGVAAYGSSSSLLPSSC